MEQMKYLKQDGKDTYEFVGAENATASERQELKIFDESCVELYGKHMITNYKEL